LRLQHKLLLQLVLPFTLPQPLQSRLRLRPELWRTKLRRSGAKLWCSGPDLCGPRADLCGSGPDLCCYGPDLWRRPELWRCS